MNIQKKFFTINQIYIFNERGKWSGQFYGSFFPNIHIW